MWKVEDVNGTLRGKAFLIRNTRNGGYLATNGPGGGALHFGTEDDANEVCEALNSTDVR